MPPTYYQYPSDDGTVYQVNINNSYGQATLGELAIASGTEPILFCERSPRVFIVVVEINDFPVHIPVVCSPSNPTYLSGPGTIVSTVFGDGVVTATYGETQRWQT